MNFRIHKSFNHYLLIISFVFLRYLPVVSAISENVSYFYHILSSFFVCKHNILGWTTD